MKRREDLAIVRGWNDAGGLATTVPAGVTEIQSSASRLVHSMCFSQVTLWPWVRLMATPNVGELSRGPGLAIEDWQTI
jgi:hypothetical protein